VRVAQPKASKGSQYWLQVLVNEQPERLNAPVREALGFDPTANIEWRSPLACDEFAEYRDEAFLNLLGIRLERVPLEAFWPKRGPQWDALGLAGGNEPLLVEAKAHLAEFASPPCQASQESLALIRKSLAGARTFFCQEAAGPAQAAEPPGWTGTYYQYTNRLAHLYLLRNLNGIPAHLLFVNLVNASDVNGPTSADEWHEAIAACHCHLGLPMDRPLSHVGHVFVDVENLAYTGEQTRSGGPDCPIA